MEGSNGQGSGGREHLLNDLKLVIRDAAQLMNGGLPPGEARDAAFARFAATLSVARDSLAGSEQQLLDAARDAADAAQRYVRLHPWQSVGIGALAGLALGLLLGRR
ncbi:glycine zipper domain-containing protein [Noviherbaspirillum aridicola]|uniref:DUF883 domain-containing protein n=1 Tax=Noviherbaspirillum aridicola TaxID=2849687 RepID=A0ABQ4Q6V1_9BURK|nr:DUF883 domain-containing protein [Noviherbaspirillum aridicola]GIZ52947.1 hypothetical protein NCCP691_29610 [Noviherbaspirillum aridicola]